VGNNEKDAESSQPNSHFRSPLHQYADGSATGKFHQMNFSQPPERCWIMLPPSGIYFEFAWMATGRRRVERRRRVLIANFERSRGPATPPCRLSVEETNSTAYLTIKVKATAIRRQSSCEAENSSWCSLADFGAWLFRQVSYEVPWSNTATDTVMELAAALKPDFLLGWCCVAEKVF
jgi:hypothetical protein